MEGQGVFFGKRDELVVLTQRESLMLFFGHISRGKVKINSRYFKALKIHYFLYFLGSAHPHSRHSRIHGNVCFYLNAFFFGKPAEPVRKLRAAQGNGKVKA